MRARSLDIGWVYLFAAVGLSLVALSLRGNICSSVTHPEIPDTYTLQNYPTLFGDSDPSTQGWEAIFQERVPGARGQPHQTLERAGHFWQEDCGDEAARIIVQWIEATA